MTEVFSEYFARRENPLTRSDARIKIIFIIAAVAAVLSAHTPFVPLAAALLVLICLFSIRIPLKIMALRVSASLGIALMLCFVKIFLFYQSPVEALLIASKIIGATSLILFLSMTTTIDRLLGACRWFKVPGTWIEICMIAYRYIFVLLEDASTVLDAQRARLGYSSLPRALRSLGILSGAIIIRAYDQSVAAYEAMMLRGYKGD